MGEQPFSVGYKKSRFFGWAVAPAQIFLPPKKSLWGGGGNLISSMRRGEFKPTKPKGSVMGIKRGSIHGMQGDSSTPKPSGIMKVTILDFDLAGVQYPTISCWF